MLNRKHQILAKIETQEGSDASPVGTDAVLVLNADVRYDRAMQERNATSTTLSREADNVGRSSATATFDVDVRGSGAMGTAPEWGKLARACSMREYAMARLTWSATLGAPRSGETCTQLNSNAVGVIAYYDGTYVYVAERSGLFTTNAPDTITCASSGAQGTATAISRVSQGMGYLPDSERAVLVTLTVAGWTGGTPAVGQTITFTSGSTTTSQGIIRAVDADEVWVEPFYGFPGVNDTIATSDSKTGTVHASTAPYQTWTPSLTIYSNKDTFRRKLVGCRGNLTMEASASESCKFGFTFTGEIGGHGPSGLLTPTYSTTQSVLRAVSSNLTLDGTTSFIVQSFNLDMGNNVVLRPDANQAEGQRGTFVTGRDPTLTVSLEAVHPGVEDFFSHWSGQTMMTFYARLGSSAGNRVIVAAPNCQVQNVEDGDQDGIMTFTVTLKPRRTTSNGDDEILLASM